MTFSRDTNMILCFTVKLTGCGTHTIFFIIFYICLARNKLISYLYKQHLPLIVRVLEITYAHFPYLQSFNCLKGPTIFKIVLVYLRIYFAFRKSVSFILNFNQVG